MSDTWFYGDYRSDESPLAFLTYFEAALARPPHLSESEKCSQFYNRCKSDFDAENWYENLEENTPAAVTSWTTLALHFRVKWLGASPSSLLEPVSKKPDTATPIATETPTTTTVTNANKVTTTTTAIPAPTNSVTTLIHETTTAPERHSRVAEVRHVTTQPAPEQVQVEAELTATERRRNEEMAVGREEEEERGIEKWKKTGKREVRR
jgi:hypothetical protein